MKNWANTLFPLAIVGALAGLTFWLKAVTEPPAPKEDVKLKHEPDYIVTGARLRKIDETGRLRYTLNVQEMRHFPDDETSHMTSPVLVYLQPTKPTVTVSADRAIASRDGEEINLYDNVRIHRAASGKEEAMLTKTSALTVFPNQEKAHTEKPVEMTQGKSWVTGVGMQIDHYFQTYVINAQARAVIEGRQARK